MRMAECKVDKMALEVLLQTGGELGRPVFENAKKIATRPSDYDYIGTTRNELDYTRLRTLLAYAVEDAMRPYDHIGLLLSGGVDSTLLLRLITDLTEVKVTAYHTDWMYQPRSEVTHAIRAAALCDVELKLLDVSPSAQIEFIDEALYNTRAIDYTIIAAYIAFKKMKFDGMDACANALGMDEMFAGYSSHRKLYRQGRWKTIIPFIKSSRKLVKALMRRYGNAEAFFVNNFFINPNQNFVKTTHFDSTTVAREMYEACKAKTLWDTLQRWTLWHMNDNYRDNITRAAEAADTSVIFPYIYEPLLNYTMNIGSKWKKNKAPIRWMMEHLYDIPPSLANRGSDWENLEKWDKIGWGGVIEPYLQDKKFMNHITPSSDASYWFTDESVEKYLAHLDTHPTRAGMQMIIFLRIAELLGY